MHCISLVISGPAGVGKTTICDRLVREFEASLKRVITSTTRRPRNSEKHGIDYYFLSNQQFEDLKEKNSFIEHAKIHGNYYGTTKESVEEQLEKKFDVLLNIDVQGAAELKKLKQSDDLFTNFLYTIFIAPKSIDDLRKRLISRGQDSIGEIEKRLQTAINEISLKDRFDFVIYSDTKEIDYAKVREFYMSKSIISN